MEHGQLSRKEKALLTPESSPKLLSPRCAQDAGHQSDVIAKMIKSLVMSSESTWRSSSHQIGRQTHLIEGCETFSIAEEQR